MVTFEDIRNNAEIRTYIEKGNENLGVLGFTKHSIGHATKVSDMAARILEELNYDARTVELARIAGYMHDIGIGYGSINHPVDRDPLCGYNGIIDDTCPCCHRGETTRVTERIKRIKVEG